MTLDSTESNLLENVISDLRNIQKKQECTPEYNLEIIERDELSLGFYQIRKTDPITGWEIGRSVGYFKILGGRLDKFY